MCLYRNLLLVFGGTGFPFGQFVSNDLYVLDLNRRHWKRCQIGEQRPQQVYGAVQIIFQVNINLSLSLSSFCLEYDPKW